MKRSRSILASVAVFTALLVLSSCDSSSSSDASSDGNNPSDGDNKKDYGIPWNNAITYGMVTDSRDGQVYRTVVIGTQTWMAENLNYKIDSSWWYGNSADSGAKYGRLYRWAAAMNLPNSCGSSFCASQVQSKHQGICPSGWHVPSDSEWSTLSDFIGDGSGTKLKSTTGWAYHGEPGNGTDVYGFRALPAGRSFDDAKFWGVGIDTYFWSSSEFDSDLPDYDGDNAWDRYLATDYVGLTRYNYDKLRGYSVRCLKDYEQYCSDSFDLSTMRFREDIAWHGPGNRFQSGSTSLI